eukprot:8547845-Heterocapsa_arctica.AAC.1
MTVSLSPPSRTLVRAHSTCDRREEDTDVQQQTLGSTYATPTRRFIQLDCGSLKGEAGGKAHPTKMQDVDRDQK